MYNDVEDIPYLFFKESIKKTYFSPPQSIALMPGSKILVVEGLNDDITPPGQTSTIFNRILDYQGQPGVSEDNKKALLIAAGHYGCFSGSKFDKEVLPEIRRIFS